MTRFVHAFAALALALLAPVAAHAVDVRGFSLGKGQDVWLVSGRTLPMIAMTVSLPAGSAYDPQAKPGLAAFAADLLD